MGQAPPAGEFATKPCASCGAAVIWCETGRSRVQPVDAQPGPGGYIKVYAPSSGGSPRAERVKPHLAFGRRDLRRAHHETCPQGKAWQRGRRAGQ